ncbi:MAG: GLPGLI family protein, partial [Rikenellaceae bacterium]
GREYEAWFTTEIPISEGPWKFYGLPGLIAKLHDKQKHYSFELIGFQKITEPILTKIGSDTRKIDRKEFYSIQFGGQANDLMIKVGLPNSSRKTKQYAPIELDYKD